MVVGKQLCLCAAMTKKVLIICRLPDPHVEAVIIHLRADGCSFEVWDINHPETVKFTLTLANKNDTEPPFSAVWWRYKGTSDEYLGTSDPHTAFATREWLASLRGFAALTPDVLWVNNPVSSAISNLKVRNLMVAAKIGFSVPRTRVTNSPDDAREFLTSISPGRIIYKPLTYYYEPNGVAVFTSEVSTNLLCESTKNLQLAPVTLQELVDKEYEIRATVVGNEVFAVRINSQFDESTSLDWRRGQLKEEMYSVLELPDSVKIRIGRLQREFGLKYGAYDFIVDRRGELVFLEVNPSGQWLWLEHATSIPISGAVARLLTSNIDKVPHRQSQL